MNKRLELHDILCELVNITEPDGDSHVYFDPPASVKMKYPAIRYNRKNMNVLHANNAIYKTMSCYELTVIDSKPDSELINKLLQLPYCSYDRHYKADNLNHDTFTLYY